MNKTYSLYAGMLISIACLFAFLSGEAMAWFLIAIGLLSPLSIVLPALKRKDSFLSVDFWFFGCLFLWSAMYPMDYLLGLELHSPALLQTTTMYALANFTCTFFYSFMKKVVLGYKKESNIPITGLGYTFRFETGMLLVVLGLVFLIYHVQSLGGLGAIGIENRINNFQKENSGSISVPWQIILSVGLLITASTVKRLNYYLGFVMILALFLIFGFGARGDVLFVCLPALLLVMSKKGVITTSFKKIMILFFILLFMSPLFTNLRGSVLYNQPLSAYEKYEWAYNRGETGGAFRVTMDVVGKAAEADWPKNTYLLESFSFLPSSVYEYFFGQAKFSSDKFFVEHYYPWQAQHGMSFGFSPVAEAWQLGGYPLIVLVFAIIGVIIAKLNQFKQVIILLPSLMWFQRVSFDAFANSTFFIVFFYVSAWLLNELLNKNSARAYRLSASTVTRWDGGK
ncbi:O-antigen polysaccharide polymerase Wzy [Paenibacillus curdlanolyticus]|uniref:O-antigen polysaccharide polymerase Wzy n=1 Tax=Paenibacillus curdlanolyticus TaxID=59840 RepID=UPI0011867384|nr:O-antigen polysaccharide polymerase Wzy [Paenibacillus curdlanolyticus]